MNVYGRSRFSWVDNELYFKEDLMVELIPHEIYPEHWHIKWAWTGITSPEYFNIINAKENAMTHSIKYLNGGVEEEEQDA